MPGGQELLRLQEAGDLPGEHPVSGFVEVLQAGFKVARPACSAAKPGTRVLNQRSTLIAGLTVVDLWTTGELVSTSSPATSL
jgi:hypothetical protein